MFSTCLKNFFPCSSNLKLSSADSFSLEESKINVWERVNKPSKQTSVKGKLGNCVKYACVNESLNTFYNPFQPVTYMTLILADDTELSIKEKVLLKEYNVKYESFITYRYHSKVMADVKVIFEKCDLDI